MADVRDSARGGLVAAVESIVAARVAAAVEERDQWWRERLATCVCQCDTSLHYEVCSTEGCTCTRDRNGAIAAASRLALMENEDDAEDGPR